MNYARVLPALLLVLTAPLVRAEISVTLADGEGNPQALETLVDARMTRLLLTSDEPLGIHNYRYLRQEPRPTAKEWTAVKPAMFFEGLT
jgi:hypothetical protein